MLESDLFQGWLSQMPGHPIYRPNRKDWEWCYIAQALYERDMLRPGRRGLGFAVGQEPLPALFAKYGCDVIASDLSIDQARDAGWIDSSQHAASLEILNKDRICSVDEFLERVAFRFIDMKNIPDDLKDLDFAWSSCSLEHLGSLKLGEQFIYDSLRIIRPGGVVVHTTEFNVSSNSSTIEQGGTVLFRRRDLEGIASSLESQEYLIELDFTSGTRQADSFVDSPPYEGESHLKLEVDDYVATSFGLIISRPP